MADAEAVVSNGNGFMEDLDTTAEIADSVVSAAIVTAVGVSVSRMLENKYMFVIVCIGLVGVVIWNIILKIWG